MCISLGPKRRYEAGGLLGVQTGKTERAPMKGNCAHRTKLKLFMGKLHCWVSKDHTSDFIGNVATSEQGHKLTFVNPQKHKKALV